MSEVSSGRWPLTAHERWCNESFARWLVLKSFQTATQSDANCQHKWKLFRPLDTQTTALPDQDCRPGGRRTGRAPFFDEAGRLIEKSRLRFRLKFRIGLECFLDSRFQRSPFGPASPFAPQAAQWLLSLRQRKSLAHQREKDARLYPHTMKCRHRQRQKLPAETTTTSCRNITDGPAQNNPH